MVTNKKIIQDKDIRTSIFELRFVKRYKSEY